MVGSMLIALALGQLPCAGGACPPATPNAPRSFYLDDAEGRRWTHFDPAYLHQWMPGHNAEIARRKARAAVPAQAKPKGPADPFAIETNLANGVDTEAMAEAATHGDRLKTNDPDFGARLMLPPAHPHAGDQVPLPDGRHAAEQGHPYLVPGAILAAAALLALSTARKAKGS